MESGAHDEALRGSVREDLDPHRAADAVEAPDQRDDEPTGRSALGVDQTISS
jgi:hypothetical protein